MKIDTHSDDLLKLCIKEGNEKAFATLFYAYKDKLFNFLFQITKSENKAEDLVQDVFMKIWQTRDTLSTIDNLNAYIFKIAQNAAIDQLRKMAKDILLITETLTDNETADSESPSELLLNKELKELIDNAIEQLPAQQKKIFIMRWIEGLSHEEIAHKMNISVSTAQNHMRQALINLRSYLLTHYQEIVILLISATQITLYLKK
ncbi:MAG: RNA polymerase sigma-70 factor [Bacteroides sp.]|jgi:RNA polymerase sigma-70 factor (ECF subfamily)|nr:RNA polymerase sigma-70 factor [Bacteroides sp.]MCI1683688.1 RNA polymerase sigma-70 factor [Bacteroides sp.]